MGLFEEVWKNDRLIYVDDEHNGDEYLFHELPFFELMENGGKQLGFLYSDNSLNAVTVFWSFMKSRHAIALLSPNLPAEFKADLEKLYNPFFIFDTTRTDIEGYEPVACNDSVTVFCATSSSPAVINDKIKVLLNTSGTTGSPKFVKLSEKNLIANAHSITDYLPVQGGDVTPLNLPIYYSYGLSVLTTNSLKGGKVVCSNVDIMNRLFWQKMTGYGYTSISGVPFVYEILERIGFRKNSYPSLRYLTQAGGKLADPILEKFAGYASENNIRFFVMYGQTEATARMSYLPSENLARKIGSIGIPVKDGTFELDNETGELCYSGPNVFGGYVSQPSDLAAYEQPLLLHTGDLAKVDDEGYYYITGRLKRFIKLFGNRVNLDEMETIAAGHSGKIVKCAGLNDKTLIMVVTDNSEDSNALIGYMSEKTKLHPSVFKVIFMNEYPVSQNGKVDYNKIIALYETI